MSTPTYLYPHDTQTIKTLAEIVQRTGCTLTNDGRGRYSAPEHPDLEAYDYPANVVDLVEEILERTESGQPANIVEQSLIALAASFEVVRVHKIANSHVYHVTDTQHATSYQVDSVQELADCLSAWEIARHMRNQGVEVDFWYSPHNGWSADFEA